MDRCKSLGCPSPHECFMRRPDYNCPPSFCKHTPDCTAKNNDEIIAKEKCRGWICPSDQQCVTKVVGPCQNDDCRIIRSCIGDNLPNNPTKVKIFFLK